MKRLFTVLCAAALFFPAAAVFAGQPVSVSSGSSLSLDVAGADNVGIADDNIAGARIISNTSVLIEGRKKGKTDVVFYTSSGAVVYNVTVNEPAAGRVMVEIDAQILEVSRDGGLEAGIDWKTLFSKSGLKVENPPHLNTPAGALNVMEENPGLLYFGKFQRGGLNAILNFLVTNNSGRVLANPKIMTSNGKPAEFLSGGQIPVPVSGQDGQNSVDWKDYGVGLKIKPTVDRSSGLISADLRVEVSNVDNTKGVSMGNGGGIVPAMRTRWAQTSIDIASEETIVIAGLINTEESTETTGVPLLSAIPLLGELFKSTVKKDSKTELVIFVTPRIVAR